MAFPISRFFVFLEFAPRLKMTRMIISLVATDIEDGMY